MPKPSMTPSRRTPWAGTTLAAIADAGLIAFPLKLYSDYQDRHFEAIAQADGTVHWDGQVFQSPSAAAAHVRLKVMGAREGRPYPQTNGWLFWRYKTAPGESHQLDVLRQQLHVRKG